MPTELTGTNNWRATITAPSAGENRTAASVQTMGQDLADCVVYLEDQISTVASDLSAAEGDISTLQKDLGSLDGRVGDVEDALVLVQGVAAFDFESNDGTVSSPYATIATSGTKNLYTYSHAGYTGDKILVTAEIEWRWPLGAPTGDWDKNLCTLTIDDGTAHTRTASLTASDTANHHATFSWSYESGAANAQVDVDVDNDDATQSLDIIRYAATMTVYRPIM